MLSDMSYLSIFFRIFNFVIIIGVFWYLFKKYIKTGIIKQINDRIQYLRNLNNERAAFIENAKQIDIEITQQNKLTQNLLYKLDKWKSVIQTEQENKLRKFESIKIDIENKQAIKNNILSQKIVYSQVIPQIIEDNKIEILREFANNEQAIKYQKEIIEFIKKSL